MYYFKSLEDILLETSPSRKIKKFKEFYKEFLNNNIIYEKNYEVKILEKPSYYDFSKVVLPKEVKKRKRLDTLEGKAILLHTIAHIEYSAIDLALDAALRFKGLPLKYYEDWLEVAADEIRHFLLIEELLKEISYSYGDFNVHTNLFEAMVKSDTLLERMAIVPRYLEATGLDQNPKIMEKLKSTPDAFNNKIVDVLALVLEEEIEHVRKGDTWFKFECKNLSLEPEKAYVDILEKYFPGLTLKKHDFNIEARKKAGFSDFEIKNLSNL